MGSLFPCLPDDLGLQCLLRVELNSHHNLRCVCKSWNSALKSPHFYQERKRLKISEQRICMLPDCTTVVIYDLEKKSCKRLPPIPVELIGFFCSHFAKQKLVLIPYLLPGTTQSCVWVYDFVSLKWKRGAKMPKWLTGFASAVDEEGGMIYVAGGLNFFYPILSAFVYNVEKDNWEILPDMNINSNCVEDFHGAFADGKFYVFGSSGNFQVFDSFTKNWKSMEKRFSTGNIASAFGRLYCLCERRLVEYDYRQDKVSIVGTFPTDGRLINFAVLVSNKIFVGSFKGYFMMEHPREISGGGTFKLIDIDRPQGFQGVCTSAATLHL